MWIVALLGFSGLDLVVWRRLRRDDELGLTWRLPLDLADMAFWAVAPTPPGGRYDAALNTLVPLTIEAGFRVGARALIVPCAGIVTGVIVRSVTDRALYPNSFIWLFLAVPAGMALWSYCSRLLLYSESEHRSLLAAECRRAFLAGQNAVAMGASSIVDALEGLVPILGAPVEGSALLRLADGWKSTLAQSTAMEATYLQVALLEWERAHNSHPDLAGAVAVHLPPGHGSTLLTSTQVACLWRTLEESDARGRVDVWVTGDDRAPGCPGRRLQLVVNGRILELPPDRRRSLRPVEPGPVMYLWIVVLTVISLFPSFGAIPLPYVAIVVALCLSAGWWSQRHLADVGPEGRPAVFAVAVVVSFILTAVCAGAQRQALFPTGSPNYQLGGVILLAFLGGLYFDSLGQQRWMVPAAIAGVCVVALAVGSVPVRPGYLIAVVAWSVTPFPTCWHVASALHRAGAAQSVDLQRGNRHAVDGAFQQGKESVRGRERTTWASVPACAASAA